MTKHGRPDSWEVFAPNAREVVRGVGRTFEFLSVFCVSLCSQLEENSRLSLPKQIPS